MTGLALPAIFTFTVEVVNEISAGASVVTRSRAAVINIVLAGGAVPALSTDTLILIDLVDTGPSILTGSALTVIYILMAVGAHESLITLTAELSAGVAQAPPVGAAHIGRDQSHPTWRAIGRYCNSAAVNYFAGRGAAVVLQA